MEKDNWTILDVVKWTTDYFESKGIDSPRLTIELMLCSILNIKRIDVYTQFDKPLTDNERTILRNMIIKRAERMPLQYILGTAPFLDYEILVNDSVMIPRPETELLVKTIIDETEIRKSQISILDIGTGSGCIALALAKKIPRSDVLAIDVSLFSLLTAKNNASSLAVQNVQFNECDILKELPSEKKFDIIVSNPPYIPLDEYNKLEPEVLKYEPKSALTDGGDGLSFYKRIAEILPVLLKEDGKFYFEMGFDQKDSLLKIFEPQGFNIEINDDLNGIPRVLKGWR